MPVPGSGMKEANRGADSSRGRAGSETFLFFQYGNDSTDDESGFHSHRGGQHRPDHSLPRGAFLESLRAFGVRRVFAGEGLQDHEEGFEDARRGAFGLHRVSRGERERRVRGFGVHFARAGPGGLRRSAGCRCRGVRGLEGRAAAQGGRAPDENRCRRCRCRCRCRRCCRNRFCVRTSSRRTDAFAVGGRIPAGDALRRGRFLADGGLPGRRSAEGIQSGRENAPGVHDVSLRT